MTTITLATIVSLSGCRKTAESPAAIASPPATRPSILLVTLDTTRADAIGPEAKGVETPAFNALCGRGRRFRQAYATVPQTLASHSSMMTGLYPGGHGVHENGRFLSDQQAVLAARLHEAGYRTAAFVSAFALARRFGLARGFDLYDDEFATGLNERSAERTTDRALAWLQQPASGPLFVWVHYYDPHYPYTPPEPFRARYAAHPYLGEVASMDAQLGRLAQAFEQRAGHDAAIVVVADHGEGLGDHGEQQHGNLLYQSTMHVPLLLIGPGVPAGTAEAPVSTRRVFHTILDWAGLDATHSLRKPDTEVVLGEAMKPFLDYGWQPQVMAIEGPLKAILAGRTEVYDVVADPAETQDLAATANLSRPLRASLREYPLPSTKPATGTATITEEERRKLASLGYVASETRPAIRADAPRPIDMAKMFDVLDRASGLFVREQYGQAIPLLETIVASDPHNLDAALHLAVSHAALGHEKKALEAFRRAETIAPDSSDVRTYLALHLARGNDWASAVPLLERIVAEEPDRLPPIEALAVIRERQGRFPESLQLRQKIATMRAPSASELIRTAEMAMNLGETAVALESFQRARTVQGAAFRNDLELGVLSLAAGRLPEARDALDRVAPSHPAYPLALFKRAQVSVLLHDPDAPARIETARRHANAMTHGLIERERLFRTAPR